MTKRPAGSDDGLRPKRPKTTTSPTNPATETGPDRHPVLSSRDLHLLLAFDQDLGPVPRQSKASHVPLSLIRNEEEENEKLIVMQKFSLSTRFWPQLPMLHKVKRHLLLNVKSSMTTCNLKSTPREKSLPHSSGKSLKPGILRAKQTRIASLLR